MGKQGVPQRGGVAHRRLGGKVLRGQAAGKADESQQQQKAAPHQNIMQVVRCNAHIDDIGHHQRHEQVKGGFQHFKERCKHAFALVALQVAKHPVQENSSFGVKIHLIIARCIPKIQSSSCVLHCTSCQILLY